MPSRAASANFPPDKKKNLFFGLLANIAFKKVATFFSSSVLVF